MKTRVLLGFTFEAKTQEEKNGNKMSKKKQHHQVSEDGGVWTIKTSTTLKTMELKFKVFFLDFFCIGLTSISIMPRNVGHA